MSEAHGPFDTGSGANSSPGAGGFDTFTLGQVGGALVQGGAGPVDTNTTFGRTLAARAGDTFNPRDHGAVGDGASHPFGGTAAQLAARYPWAASYPYGTLFNLPVSAPAAVGATALAFVATQAIAAGATVAAGSFVLPLADVAGVTQGMVVTLAGVPAGTQVEWVNSAALTIGLSQATTAAIAAGASVAFAQAWLSRITGGMQVSGPGIPPGTTATPTATGVALSAPITAAMVTNTAVTATSPQYEGTPVTFYAPFTDAQAALLEMDNLGIQDAIVAADAGGGQVRLPAVQAGGNWRLDQGLVFPAAQNFNVGNGNNVSLIGDGYQAAQLAVTQDLGPSRYALSCGDPTGTLGNGRGIYQSGGYICPGEWRGLSITLAGSQGAGYGFRNRIAGVPVAMSGLKQGARRNMDYVSVAGFNVGIQFQGDWTSWTYVSSGSNFIGLRFDDPMTNIFGDLRFEQVFLGGNAFAGISVSPQGSIQSAKFNKSWFGDQPYGVYLEPGPTPQGATIQQTVWDDCNFESQGNGLLVDGNVLPNGTLVGSGHTVISTEFRSPYTSRGAAQALPGGPAWAAYIDVANAWAFAMTNVREVAFQPVAGGQALLRAHRSNDYADNRGAIRIEGDLWSNLSAYAALGQEFITGGTNTDFLYTRAMLNVELVIPGAARFHLFFLNDYQMTASMGTLLEGQVTNGVQSAQRAGRAAAGTAVLLGVLANTYPAVPQGKIVPVMIEGQSLPIAVSAAQPAGTLLQLDTANPGMAASAATVTTGRFLGVVTDPNNNSPALVFIRARFGGSGL